MRAAMRSVGRPIDSTLALFINAAILIVAAALFHANGYNDVTEIGYAFRPLSPLLVLASHQRCLLLRCSRPASTRRSSRRSPDKS